MKAETYGDYLVKLTRLWMVNIYLVKEEDGLTVIDSGISGSAGGILDAAKQLGMPVKRITLTHAHVDHAGSLDALRDALPDAELALPERTAVFLGGDMRLLPGEPQAELQGGFVTAEAAADRTFKPGEMLGSLRVIAAPGHSPDQVAYLDERDGTLIAGDAFQTLGGFAVSGVMRWRFPMPAMATWHLPTAVQTARSLAALEPARLAVGHGSVLENPGRAIAAGIKEAEAKLNGQAQTA
jgi:glyoxylase-like metal-dependent hydrolase (beta-lactamase superfamily II)